MLQFLGHIKQHGLDDNDTLEEKEKKPLFYDNPAPEPDMLWRK